MMQSSVASDRAVRPAGQQAAAAAAAARLKPPPKPNAQEPAPPPPGRKLGFSDSGTSGSSGGGDGTAAAFQTAAPTSVAGAVAAKETYATLEQQPTLPATSASSGWSSEADGAAQNDAGQRGNHRRPELLSSSQCQTPSMITTGKLLKTTVRQQLLERRHDNPAQQTNTCVW